jgi:hypothetical protein
MKGLLVALFFVVFAALPTAASGPGSTGQAADGDVAQSKRCCYSNPQGQQVCCNIPDHINCQPGICMTNW